MRKTGALFKKRRIAKCSSPVSGLDKTPCLFTKKNNPIREADLFVYRGRIPR